MTSKIARAVSLAAAIAAFGRPAPAEGEIPFADAEAYYQLHVENESEGVYEWPARDLVFVHVRTPRAKGAKQEAVESAEMSATRRLLHEWLAGKAAKRRVDPILPYGMEAVRALCRKHFPLLEYTANWSFSGESRYFSREQGDEHVGTTVFKMSEALDSIPAAYLEAVDSSVWLGGLCRLVSKAYAAQGDLAFMWEAGALDSLDVSRETAAAFPSWDEEDFAASLAAFHEAANDTWKDAPSPAHGEYAAVRAEISRYLATSPTALGFLADARKLAAPSRKTVLGETPSACECTTNIVVSVVTNAVASANAVTNATAVSMGGAAGMVATMPFENKVRVESIRSDIGEICVVETATIVKTTRRTLRETVSSYSGEPRFERLFLSGASCPNGAAPRRPSSLAAEKVFYGKATQEERKAAVLGALRENPGDKVLWNLYGRVLQAGGENLGAIVCFRNALRLDREYEFALANLADAYRAMGKKELATGAAIVARGMARDPWCVKKAESVLNAKW